MPDEDDTPKAEVARERRASPPAATEEAAPEPPPDRAELEQLRARLIAKYRGRR